MMPASAAIAREVSVIGVPNTVKVTPFEKPRPHTRITAAMIRFLDFVKSTLFSTMFLTPIAEIIPYRIKLTPPMIAVGREPIIAAIFGIKLSMIAYTAAKRITRGSYT